MTCLVYERLKTDENRGKVQNGMEKNGGKQNMKFIYPAVISKDEAGKYQVRFPDLEGCTASGDSLDEALDHARDAQEGWIRVELEEGGELPHITDKEDIELDEGEIVRNISANIRFFEGWDE